MLEKYKESLSEEKQPDFVEPMLATLTKDYFDDPDWIYERKMDGERCLATKNGSQVDLFSRNEEPLNETYPEILKTLSNLEGDFIVDGEIVAFVDEVSSFSKLQERMHKEKDEDTEIDVYYYLFDILYLDEYNTTDLELKHRKQLLKNALDFSDPLRYLTHRTGNGLDYHEEACEKGWEGIIAKDGKSKYKHTRSKKWLKFKCRNQQEFIIGGYTDPEGDRKHFGALLLGYYEDEELVYAGKVGTGFSDKDLKNIGEKLENLEWDESPYDDSVDDSDVHWVKPELVCEVKFTEWTDESKLRHPAFLGLRRDKDPEKVVKETPGARS